MENGCGRRSAGNGGGRPGIYRNGTRSVRAPSLKLAMVTENQSVIRGQVNATTASPEFVSQYITHDPRLKEKTAMVVIKADGQLASVYRQSSSKVGSYSRDIYARRKGRNGRSWKRIKKHQKKYDYNSLPHPPRGASRAECHGIEIWTMKRLESAELTAL